MSIKLTTQMDWTRYATYSKYHPDNMERPSLDQLPSPVAKPPPAAEITEADRQIGAWGHKLCCERAYGPCETTTRIKDNVTPKTGGSWDKTITVERGNSTMCSAMYGGSLVERSFSALANEGVGSLKK
jgi:hypothetical protein